MAANTEPLQPTTAGNINQTPAKPSSQASSHFQTTK